MSIEHAKATPDPPRILVVDDSAPVRKGLAKLLEPLGAETIEAPDGRHGFELAQRTSVDLVISDVDMPGLDGIELCRRLKSASQTHTLPIILHSSFNAERDIERGFQAGADAYVTKDESSANLLDTIRRTLHKASFHKNRIILVVDDSRTILRLVTAGLSDAGYRVQTAANGREGLDRLSEVTPDLILSDIDMPIMNGFELCLAVRSDASTAEIPFVVMSANSDRGTMKRMLQRGAAAFITKPFNVDELVILTDRILSDQVRLLLKEKERLDFERRHMLESISSLIMALEARDTYTRGHSEAVGRIVSGMVALTGASQQEIDRATIGGRLHDIGKIGIRDAVLLKPGKLSDAEFDQIKQHPLIGAKILQSIESLADIRDIVLSHHERLDGRGYPQGLVGDGIPLLARMTAVADTFHALTSDRPYRKGLPLEKSLAIIDEARGTQLCPDCVDLFHKFLATDRADQEASQR
jgi:putative two-component system response regulator